MTNEELTAWITNYVARGLNSSELNELHRTNLYRTEVDERPVYRIERPDPGEVRPLGLCPRASMAARLFSRLVREGHSPAPHVDSFYGQPGNRGGLFGVRVSGENAGTNPTGFMGSTTGHRANLLSASHTDVGGGGGGGVLKFVGN